MPLRTLRVPVTYSAQNNPNPVWAADEQIEVVMTLLTSGQPCFFGEQSGSGGIELQLNTPTRVRLDAGDKLYLFTTDTSPLTQYIVDIQVESIAGIAELRTIAAAMTILANKIATPQQQIKPKHTMTLESNDGNQNKPYCPPKDRMIPR